MAGRPGNQDVGSALATVHSHSTLASSSDDHPGVRHQQVSPGMGHTHLPGPCFKWISDVPRAECTLGGSFLSVPTPREGLSLVQ